MWQNGQFWWSRLSNCFLCKIWVTEKFWFYTLWSVVIHSVKTSRFSCYSGFTWNQSWRMHSLKICLLTRSRGSEVWFLCILCTFWRLKKSTKLTNLRAAPKMAKIAISELLHSSKLISRKIWVTEKSRNFHTVFYGSKTVISFSIFRGKK